MQRVARDAREYPHISPETGKSPPLARSDDCLERRGRVARARSVRRGVLVRAKRGDLRATHKRWVELVVPRYLDTSAANRATPHVRVRGSPRVVRQSARQNRLAALEPSLPTCTGCPIMSGPTTRRSPLEYPPASAGSSCTVLFIGARKACSIVRSPSRGYRAVAAVRRGPLTSARAV
jgi:hypothetical protein